MKEALSTSRHTRTTFQDDLQMNGLTLMAVVIVCLWLGYHFYGRWLEKT